MNRKPSRRAILSGVAVVLVILSLGGCEKGSKTDRQPGAASGDFKSNGERIYFTATSRSGKAITAAGSMMMMHGELRACADCHGEDGRGREIDMMMHSFTTPAIRYGSLTSEHHHHGEEAGEGHGGEVGEHHGEEAGEEPGGEPEHPPYTDETIRRAITLGLDPAGNALSAIMPRWNMSEEDLDDLLSYLKTLK